MPKELYEEVKDDIPKHIGVYTGSNCIKKAKKQELSVDEQVLKDSLIRSLSREFTKQFKSGNPNVIDSLNRQINYHKKESERYRRQYQELNREAIDKFGTRWNR